MSNFKSIGQGVRGLRPPEIGGFPLTLNVALTTVLRSNVLHCAVLCESKLKGSKFTKLLTILRKWALADHTLQYTHAVNTAIIQCFVHRFLLIPKSAKYNPTLSPTDRLK